MKKILIAGGSGFVGRYLALRLAENKDYKILATYFKNKPQTNYPENVSWVKADLTDPKQTEPLFNGIDYCFHLATKIRHLRIKSEGNIFPDNLKMHLNIFEAASKHKIKRIIYLTSMSLMKRLTVPRKSIQEEYFWEAKLPKTGYSASKLIGDYCCLYYFEDQGLPYTIIRILASPYGYLDELRKDNIYLPLHNEVIKNVALGNFPLRLPATGKWKKGLIHLKDYAEILARSLDKGAENQEIHVGADDYITLDELARITYKIAKPKGKLKIIWDKNLRMYNINFKVDNLKAKKILKYQQTVKLEDGIKELVQLCKEF